MSLILLKTYKHPFSNYFNLHNVMIRHLFLRFHSLKIISVHTVKLQYTLHYYTQMQTLTPL